MNRLDIEVSAAEQLGTVHALIGRLLFQPSLPPESFPAALLRELRYARTELCGGRRRGGYRLESLNKLLSSDVSYYIIRFERHDRAGQTDPGPVTAARRNDSTQSRPALQLFLF